jgi:hypothetical protein
VQAFLLVKAIGNVSQTQSVWPPRHELMKVLDISLKSLVLDVIKLWMLKGEIVSISHLRFLEPDIVD